MNKLFRPFLATALLASVLTGCGQAQQAAPKTGGSAEGSVPQAQPGTTASTPSELTIYTALEDDQIKAYLESFKQANPNIKLNIVRDSTGIITAKLLAEKENPQADVVWGVAATSLLVLDQNNMLEGYSPKGVERISPEFKDKQQPEHWVGIDAWETAIIANTKELEKKHLPIPQSYDDLIKPEYKGMVVMPDPSASGTGFLTINGLRHLKGEQGSWTYLDKLNDNIAMYTQSGSKPAKMAAAGEYPIGISFGYRGITEKKKGAPVEVVFPKEGSGWDVEANALMKKPTIKPEAKLFLDWAITDEAMKEYNKNYAIIGAKQEGAQIPEGYTKNPLEQLIKLDLNQAAKDRDQVLQEWQKRYSSKSEPKK